MHPIAIFFIVLCVIDFIIILISIYFSYSLIYPMNHPITESPKDYGMEYEDIEFVTEDNVTLKGWHISAKSNNLIIVVHPGYFSRVGFDPNNQGLAKITDIEVKFLPTIKQLNKAGYSIIFFIQGTYFIHLSGVFFGLHHRLVIFGHIL